MIIIIDGYNLLKQVYPYHKKTLERHRVHFIQQMANYKGICGGKVSDIIIVFDAGPVCHATREIKRGVTVIFSGQRSSADDWIMHYIDKNKGHQLLVVTKDRAIISHAHKNKAQSMDVMAFHSLTQQELVNYNQVNIGINHTDDIRELHNDSVSDQLSSYSLQIPKDELALLIENASIGIQDDSISSDNLKNKSGNSLKLSKKERKAREYLKKLRK